LRTVQMALVHVSTRPIWVKAVAQQCDKMFPHKDWRVNRELAILLTYFRREGQLATPVHAKLFQALLADTKDRPQQIHSFYCLRLLDEGWTAEQKSALLAWYDATKTWTGGHSFSPFLENILGDSRRIFTQEDRSRVLARAEELPWAVTALLRMTREKET